MRTGPGLTAGSWRVWARVVVLVLSLAGLAGCSTDPADDRAEPVGADVLINGGGPVLDGSEVDGRVVAPDASGTYEPHVCGVVLDWTYELVAVVNGFTTVSRTDTPAERRVDYVRAFDDALALVDELEVVLAEGPAPPAATTGAALLAAVAAARDELDGARQAARDLPLDAYEVRRVRSGKLFVASEKARSLVFSGLDSVATDEGLRGLRSPCGRPQYPDAG